MARKKGNDAQESALEKLLVDLTEIGKGDAVRNKCQTALTTTSLWVKLDLPNFPLIKIGRRAGFEMPDISTHPPHSDRFDGIAKTAYEACLKGDRYVERQGSGAARDSAFLNLPWEPF